MTDCVPQAVVFDIGGVLLDWNPRHLYRKLFGADEAAMERFLAEICTDAWNLEQDRGRPWAEATEALVRRHPEHEANIRAYRQRWPEMIAGPIAGAVAILEDLDRGGVPLYALTNFAADTFALTRDRFDFMRRFRSVVVSGEEGIVKPDPAIFALLIGQTGLKASELVFIDDSGPNVAAARAAGLCAIRFTSADALRPALAAAGLAF